MRKREGENIYPVIALSTASTGASVLMAVPE
jgi:hypothetical protein